MKNFIFEFIDSWTSYNRYKWDRIRKSKELYEKHRIDAKTLFRVDGAGNISISNSPECRCGGKNGFAFDVSWGQYGYVGGVLSKEEAIKLAEHILSNVKKDS